MKNDHNWSPMKFEEVADEVDKKDSELGEGGGDEGERSRNFGRPYLVLTGIEERIKFIFTMSPYVKNDCNEYP